MSKLSEMSRRGLLGAAGASIVTAANAQGNRAMRVARVGSWRGIAQAASLSFRGIAYGADTGGANRFRPPQPVRAGLRVRNATQYGPQCPQTALPMPGLFGSWIIPQESSEDCLRLNVWTPAADRNRRPVMVFIHSGGFTHMSGTTHVYDGTRLAERRDVVVVTLNHRLNAFGYLNLAPFDPEFADSANVGMLDLVAALEWVKAHIGSFGGDPANVTVFGESGGGWKIGALMAMPSAQGLFKRAILQSGALPEVLTAEAAEASAAALLGALGLSREEAGRLRTLPVDRVVAGMTRVVAGMTRVAAENPGLHFAPSSTVGCCHASPSPPMRLPRPAMSR
jgi:para-nitrobenzyl esterase